MSKMHRKILVGAVMAAVVMLAYGSVVAEQVTLHHFIDSSPGVAFREFIEEKGQRLSKVAS